MSSTADLGEARQRIELAYDARLLRTAGHRLVDLLADQFALARTSEGKVLPWCEPAENVRQAAAVLEEAVGSAAGREALADHFARIVQTMLQHGHNLHDPRYIGHQVAASVPLAGLFDAVGGVTNQGMAIYDMGPWGTAAEWAMVEKLGEQIGWQRGQFAGLVTHGGSLANLTGLLTARNVCLEKSWELGTGRPGSPPVIVVHTDAHYSVTRAAGILGLGTNQVIRVRLDSRRRMDVAELEKTLRELRTKKQPIVAVVSCACSTPVGAFDQLNEVADVCQRHGVWLHVDAAHGGTACLSPRPIATSLPVWSVPTAWSGTHTRCCSCPPCVPSCFTVRRPTGSRPFARMPPTCSIRRRRESPSSTAVCGRSNAPSGRPSLACGDCGRCSDRSF